MTYGIDDEWSDDVGRVCQPAFSDADVFEAVTTPPPCKSCEQLTLELQRLWHDNEGLEQEVRRLSSQNAQLRARLVGQSVPRDTSTLDDAVHVALADRFRDLVQQDMQHIVRSHLQSIGGRVTAETIALEVRALCEDLLTGDYDASQACRRLGMDSAVLAVPLQELITKVNTLTDQATQEAWDFQVISGAHLDANKQRPWGQCDPRHPVHFAVAPAYRANGRTYALQLVFTAPKFRLRR